MASFDYNFENPSFYHANYNYCSLLSTRITKIEFAKQNEINSGSCSQMTSL